MEFNQVKEAVKGSSLLSGLDEALLASLLWSADEVDLARGESLYEEGDLLDGSFALLLNGSVEILQGETARKTVRHQDESEGEYPVMGGFAYFHKDHIRTVTTRVASDQASFLKFHVTTEQMLESDDFKELRDRLSAATGRHWSEDQQ